MIGIKWLIWIGIIKGIYTLLFRLTEKWDPKENDFLQGKKIFREGNFGALFLGTVTLFVTEQVWQIPCGFWKECFHFILIGVINGSFLFAMLMDYRVQKVYHFVWWIAGGCAILLWIVEGGGQVIPLLIFWLLQQRVFAKLYGRADCHAFCVCGVLIVALKGTMEDIWLHMTGAFAGLFLIQLIRGNVDRYGRLKNPVPFIPYIWCAFWLYLGWFLSLR